MNTSKEALFDILKYPAISRLAPLRIILKKDDDGNYLGYCENSFSMSWEKDRIQIHWSGTAYSNLGTTHTLDATEITGPEGVDCECLDPLSDSCPIEIDWESWANAKTKYDKRNARFKIRKHYD
jgi:hypothetical protein